MYLADDNTLIWFFLISILAVFPPVLAILRRNDFDPFEPVYLWILLYSYLYLVRPLVYFLTEAREYSVEFDLTKALTLALIGLMSFYIGYYMKIGKKLAGMIPIISSPVSVRHLRRSVWCFAILGIGAYGYFVQQSGGHITFFSQAHGAAGKYEESTAYLYQAIEFLFPAFFILYRDSLDSESKVRKMLVLGLFGLPFLLFVLYMGERDYTFYLIIGVVLLSSLKNETRPRLPKAALLAGAMFIILGLLPTYRTFFYIGSDLSQIKDLNPVEILEETALKRSTSDEFAVYLKTVTLVPEYVDYQYGRLYLQLFIHWIPKSIWPNKPSLNPEEKLMLFENPIEQINSGASGAILDDLYFQFGLLGIVLGTFVSGILWQSVYSYFKRAPHVCSVQVIFATSLVLILVYIAQAPYSFILKYPFFILPVIVSFLYARCKSSPARV